MMLPERCLCKSCLVGLLWCSWAHRPLPFMLGCKCKRCELVGDCPLMQKGANDE